MYLTINFIFSINKMQLSQKINETNVFYEEIEIEKETKFDLKNLAEEILKWKKNLKKVKIKN